LQHLYQVWGRPVHIETVIENKVRMLFSHGPDGPERRKLKN
jgi:spore cortex formation protein SpoVR/YcgB (stage V sporulation)